MEDVKIIVEVSNIRTWEPVEGQEGRAHTKYIQTRYNLYPDGRREMKGNSEVEAEGILNKEEVIAFEKTRVTEVIEEVVFSEITTPLE